MSCVVLFVVPFVFLEKGIESHRPNPLHIIGADI